MFKIDSVGNIEWQQELNNAGEAESIKQTTDSGYIAACYSGDYLVAKLDKHGMIEWEKSYGGSGEDYPTSIQQTFDKGYIVNGSAHSNDGDVNDTSDEYSVKSAWLIKLDSVGAIEWKLLQRADSADYGKIGYQVKQDYDSSYIITMFKYNQFCDEDGCEDFALADSVMKISKDGKIKKWGVDLSEYIFSGYNTDVEIVKGGYITSSTASDYGFKITKINSSGSDFIWTLYIDNGGVPFSLSCNADNACVVAGSGLSLGNNGDTTGNHGGYDFYVAKFQDETILPVKLLSFTAQKQNTSTLLQWQTANEINNDHFSIERSADSKLFTLIGNKPATNNALRSNYSFVDNAPLNGINYYRLKQVDKDGKFSYSKIVSVDFATSNNALFSISPNPAKNHISITSYANVSDAQIIITSANGRTLFTTKHSFSSGEQLNVPVAAMANQTLFVTINTSNGKQEFKVVKE